MDKSVKNKSTMVLHSSKKIKSQRKFCFDNFRCFLIVCVVFGHLLEICTAFRGSILLYRIIYSFHMPCFIFLSGYFSKYNPKRILFNYLIPYIVFQTLYIGFCRTILHIENTLQYTTPYWILWFLLSSIYYQLLLPFFDTDQKKWQIIFLLAAIVLSFLIGYENSVGYYASLSRFFVFLPWFLLGFYFRKNSSIILPIFYKKRSISIFAFFIIIFSVFFLRSANISSEMLYGSYSYASLGYSALFRLVFFLIALSWIIILFMLFTKYIDFNIPIVTTIGQNTLPVFLLHGFVVKLIRPYFPDMCRHPYAIILLTCAIVIAFGNRYLGVIFKRVFNLL